MSDTSCVVFSQSGVLIMFCFSTQVNVGWQLICACGTRESILRAQESWNHIVFEGPSTVTANRFWRTVHTLIFT